MEKRFGVLRFIGTVFKILGVIVAVLTIIGAVAMCVISVAGTAFLQTMQEGMGMIVNGAVAGIIAAVFALLAGAINAMWLYGLGEGIFLALAVEENTRKTSFLMQQYSTEPIVPEV